MKKRICCIFFHPTHYRKAIYCLLDRELECDFYFGDRDCEVPIRKMDCSLLRGFKKEVKTTRLGCFHWQHEIWKLAFHNYDSFIMMGDSWFLSYWILMYLALLRGRKVYLWGHGPKTPPKRWDPFFQLFLRRASGFFLYGNWGRKIMEQAGVPKERLHVIGNSLDYDEQLAFRQQLKPSDIYKKQFRNDDPVLVFVGRLIQNKELELLLEAQKILTESGIFFNLCLIGDGPMREKLEKIAQQYGLQSRIWFRGACFDEKINGELIFNADLCVSPGCVGLTAIHALTFGTPVISHDRFELQMPEFESIIPGKTGDFFLYGNVKSLAEKIAIWLPRLCREREAIRLNCYHVIEEKFNPHYQIEIFKQVLAGKMK